ncbi:bifunctional DNA primase/polymerase [Solwaraspora sp. WMMB762]|uniref:bifunctional DNA primase/polymerase n=1 Tax=Solwaraspora sp. WMMB762 TaxID=3404120 RepID=UPI003B94680D
MPDTRLTAALDYTARGWPVFILGRTRRPLANCPACRTADPDHDPAGCACLTCHGFYAATRDPDRLRAMLAAHPGGLLAIRTGATADLVVVDIDPRNGGRLDPDLMPPTAAVRTGGGGWHLFYRHPGGMVPSRPLPGRPGVDIKADRGYVVAPPSRHPETGRPYVWVRRGPAVEMHPALRAATGAPAPTAPTRPRQPDQMATSGTARSAGGISSPAALLAALVNAVETAPEGRRRTTLYGSARGAARMVAAGAISDDAARTTLTTAGRNAGQTERDIHAAIEGGFRAEGVTT